MDRIAIIGRFIDSEGHTSTSFGNAKVDCERCEELGGWSGEDSGLHCPYGCGVRVVSTQAEDDERWRQQMDVEEQIRRDRRALRRAKRT